MPHARLSIRQQAGNEFSNLGKATMDLNSLVVFAKVVEANSFRRQHAASGCRYRPSAAAIPNAQLILYPDANHGSQYQYPEFFLQHVSLFLGA
jgi:hypothetical protein